MPLPDPDQLPLPPGRELAHPLASATVVIYATLALLALTVPRGLANWLGDMEPNAVQQVMLGGAEGIARFADATGIDRPYARARATFLQATGKRED
jgi:deoxyribodipyrimidine photolyase-like uncharacterized protein